MSSKTSKILIADDNLQNLELVEAYLADIDCEVITAADGMETLEKAKSQKPDLLVLDVMMPKLSGFEVCQQLKSNPQTSSISILMVTALHEKADIDRGVEAGADDFLSKPILKSELVQRVNALLKVRHVSGELDRTLAYYKEIEATSQNR